MQETEIVQGSSVDPLYFVLVSSTDHTTPVIGASPTVVISQNAGGFATPVGAIFEAGNGTYGVSPNALDVGVAGPLLLNATAAGADVASRRYQVVSAYGVPPLSLHQANYPLTFLLVSASDHLTGIPGLTPTTTLKQVGGPYQSPAGAVMEIGGSGNGLGFYYVAGNALDTAVAGPLLLYATAAGVDVVNDEFNVANPPPLPAGTYDDLMAGVVAQLRSSGPLIAALGENVNVAGGTKIWADDLAMGQPSPPYLTYAETAQTIQGTTGTLHVDTGVFTISIVHASKLLCRLLGGMVMTALDDSQPIIADGNVRYLRHNNQRFQTIPSAITGSSVGYKMMIDFDYMIAGNFSV